MQAQSFNRAAVYEVGIRYGFLGGEEQQKVTAALSGDKYLWEKLSAAQEKFRVKHGYYVGAFKW